MKEHSHEIVTISNSPELRKCVRPDQGNMRNKICSSMNKNNWSACREFILNFLWVCQTHHWFSKENRPNGGKAYFKTMRMDVIEVQMPHYGLYGLHARAWKSLLPLSGFTSILYFIIYRRMISMSFMLITAVWGDGFLTDVTKPLSNWSTASRCWNLVFVRRNVPNINNEIYLKMVCEMTKSVYLMLHNLLYLIHNCTSYKKTHDKIISVLVNVLSCEHRP